MKKNFGKIKKPGAVRLKLLLGLFATLLLCVSIAFVLLGVCGCNNADPQSSASDITSSSSVSEDTASDITSSSVSEGPTINHRQPRAAQSGTLTLTGDGTNGTLKNYTGTVFYNLVITFTFDQGTTIFKTGSTEASNNYNACSNCFTVTSMKLYSSSTSYVSASFQSGSALVFDPYSFTTEGDQTVKVRATGSSGMVWITTSSGTNHMFGGPQSLTFSNTTVTVRVGNTTPIAPPSAANKTYNGGAQTIISNFDSNKMTSTCSYTAPGGSAVATTANSVSFTNAGSYAFTFTPKSGYVWNDTTGGNGTRTATATISKASLYVTISYGTVTYGTTSAAPTVTVKRGTDSSGTTITSGYGTVSYAVSASSTSTANASYPGKATVASDGKISPSGAGKIQIKISIATNTNYNAGSATCDVTIGRAGVALPTDAAPTYNGSSQTIFSGYDSNKMTVGTGQSVSQKDAGSYTVSFTPTANYKWSSDSSTTAKPVTGTIKAKSISFTWGTIGTYTYNGSSQGPTGSAASGVSGETLNFEYNSCINAGTYTRTATLKSVTGGQAKISNYSVTGLTSGSFTIGRAGVALPAAVADLKYNGSSQTIFSGYDSAKMSLGSGQSVSQKDAGSYTVSFTPGGNYKWSSDNSTTAKPVTGTIGTKSIAFSWGTIGTYTYNKSSQGPTGSASSGVSGETLNFKYSDCINAGSYTSRTVSLLSVTGGQAKTSNYTLTGTTSGAFTIGKKALTASSTASNKVYDGTTTATVTLGTVDGNLDGSNLTVTATGAFTDKNVGNNKNVSISYTLGGTAAGNYSMAAITKTANITQKNVATDGAVTITGTYTYNNGAAITPTYTVTNSAKNAAGNSTTLTKDTDYTVAITNNTQAGTGKVTVTGIGNYNGTKEATFTIGKATIPAANVNVVAWDDKYDGNSHNGVKTASVTMPDGTSGTFTYSTAQNGTYSATVPTVKNYTAGTTIWYKITNANFNDYTGSVSAKVNKRVVTVTAANKTSVYGNTIVPLTATVSGTDTIVSGETDSVYTLSTTATATSNVNTYTITVTVKSNSNYTVTAVNGTYTITQRGLTIILTATDCVYDGNAHAAALTSSNVISQDTGTMTNANLLGLVTYTYTNGAESGKMHAGTYKATFALSASTPYSNYSLDASSVSSVTYTISPKDITGATVSFTDPNNIYYTGSSLAQTPDVSVKLGSNTSGTHLTAGTDFSVAYNNSVAGAGDVTGAGTVTMTVTGTGNYTGTATQTANYVIHKARITAVEWHNTAAGTDLEFNYDASSHTPKITKVTTNSNAVLPSNLDDMFTYAYTGDQVNQGDYEATATMDGAFTNNFEFDSGLAANGNKTTTKRAYKVVAAAIILIDSSIAAAVAYSGTYNGKKSAAIKTQNLKTSISADAATLQWWYSETNNGADWTLTMPEFTDAGNYTVYYKVTARNHADYTGSVVVGITAKTISTDGTIAVDTQSVDYTGSAITSPKPVIKNAADGANEVALVLGTDYEIVSYTNNVNAGTATINVSGKGNYTGNWSVNFAINKVALVGVSVTVYGGASGATYDGDAHRVLTAQTANVITGAQASDTASIKWYYATSDIAVDAASGWSDTMPEVTDVSDSKTVWYKIEANNHETSTGSFGVIINAKDIATDARINGGAALADITYTGSAIKPSTFAVENELVSGTYTGLTLGTDYDLSYTDNLSVGTATITITGKGNYTGSTQITFDIVAANGITASAAAYGGAGGATYDGYAHNALENQTLSVLGGTAENNNNNAKWYYSLTDLNQDADDAGWLEDMPRLRNATAGTTVYWMVTADNCAPVFGSATVIIKKARITGITGITSESKPYDGTVNAVDADGNTLLRYDGVTFTGVQGNDILYITSITGATFGGINYGTYNVTVPRTGITVKSRDNTGADNDDYLNYELGLTSNIIISGVQITSRVVEVSWSNLTPEWDNNRELKPTATITNLVAGDTVTAIFKVTQAGAEVVSTAPGKYTATITGLEGDTYGNYTIVGASKLSTLFEITTAGTIVRWDASGLVYDGTAKLPNIYYEEITGENETIQHVIGDSALESGTYMVIKDSSGNELSEAVNAGHYTVTLTLNVNHVWSDDLNGINREKTISFTVEKATVTGYKLLDGTDEVSDGDTLNKTYNGTPYALTVDWSGVTIGTATGMPVGVSVVMLYNGAAGTGITNAGHQVVTARFTVNGNFYAIDDISVDLIIAKREYNINDAEYDVTFADDDTPRYDGALHTIAISGTLPEGVSVVYSYVKDGVSYGTSGVKEVGEYTVTARFILSDGDNNKLVDASGAEVTALTAKLTINKQAADVSGVVFADKLDAVYNGGKQQLYVTGVTDALGVTGVTYEYRVSGSSEVIGTDGVKNVGTYTVTAIFAVDGTNYDDTTPITKTATLVISRKALTVTVADAEIVYGDDPAAGAYTASFSGLAATDTELDLGTLVLTVDSTVYIRYGNVGEYANAIKASGLNTAVAANYDVTYNLGTLTVTAKELTVRWQKYQSDSSTALVYTYAAGVEQAPYAVATNTVHEDVVTLTVEGGQINAGLNYVARVTEVLQNGVVSQNYVLPANGLTVTFDILPSPKNGIILWDNTVLYYNGTEQAPKAYYYEDENDNMPKELTVTTDRRAINASVAGTHYTATASLGGNYTLTGEQTKQFTIEKRTVYIVIGNLSVNYGETPDMSAVGWTYYLSDKTHQFLDNEDYTLTFTSSAIAGSAKGTYAITGSFTSNNGDNYEVIFTNEGTLTVTEANYDMSGVTFANTTVTYTGATQTIRVNGLPEGVTATFNYTKGGWSYGPDGVAGVGVYTVIVSFTGNSEYGAIADKTVTFTINKAALTITANDVDILYGDEPVTNGVTYSIEGIESELNGTLTLSLDYERYGTAGKYKITPDGLSADNYEITFKDGTLTVAPKALTVTWYSDESKTTTGSGANNNEFVYDYADGVTHQPYAVAEGTVNGDTVTLTVDGGKIGVGLNYTATITGISSENYYVPEEYLTAIFSITKAGEVIWDNTPLYYNGLEQAPKAYYFAEGSTTPTGLEVTVSGAHKDAGVEYTATLTGKLSDGVTAAPVLAGETSCTYTILKKHVTVQIGDGALVYGAVEGSLAATLSGIALTYDSDAFVAADGVPVQLSCSVNNTSNVGGYEISGACTNGNYEITFTSGTLTITKATVNVNGLMTDSSKAYTGLAQTIEVSALPAGVEKVTYTYYNGSVSEANKLNAGDVINVGTYVIVATFTADNNHEISGACQATLTITKANLNTLVTLENLTVTYDGNMHKLLLSGDTAGVDSVTFTYGGVECDGVKNEGTYAVVATLNGDTNHNSATLTGTLVIKKASLTVSVNAAAITYGDDPATATFGATYFGLAGSDSESDLGALVFAVDNAVYKQYDVAGVYANAITVSGLSGAVANNYNITYKYGTLTVTPKELTSVDWYKDSAKTSQVLEYEYVSGATTEYIPYAEANGTVNGDTVVLKVEIAKSAVGNDYVARVTAILNADGSVNNNYALPVKAFETSFAVIYTDPENHAYEIVWSYSAQYYDGTAKKPAASYYDEVTGGYEDIDPADVVIGDKDGNELTAGAIAAGEYTAWVRDTENRYTNSQVKMTFSVSARLVYIVIGDASVDYNETPNMNAVTWKYLDDTDDTHKFVSGDAYTFTFTTTAIKGSAVGTYAISGSFASPVAANYEVVFTGSWASAGADNGKCGTLTVNKATYDMGKVTFVGTEVVYNGYKQTITVNGLPEGLTATCVYTLGSFGGNSDGVKNAGTYTVTVSFAGDANYYPVADRTTTFKIKKAALEVHANDNTIIYGDEPEANGLTFTGFVGADTEATANVLTGAAVYAYDYDKNGNVGTYAITPSGLGSDNYEITFRAGTLTVTPRTVTVTWYDDYTLTAQSFAYIYKSGVRYQPYAVLGNLVEGDTVTLTVTDTQSAGTTSPVGSNYTARVSALGNANYTLPTDGSNSVLFTVKPVSSTAIVWDNTPLYYNGNPLGQAPRAYLVNDDGTEKTLNLTPSSYGINANTLYIAEIDPNNNADVDLNNLTGSQAKSFTILPLPVTVQIGAASAVYGAVEDTDSWTFAGAKWSYVGDNTFKGSDGQKVVLVSVASNSSNVGEYAIGGKLESGNYEVTFIAGTLTVNKATVTVTDSLIADGTVTKTYNGLAQTAEVKALPNGVDKVTYTYYKDSVSDGNKIDASEVVNVGTYIVVATFTADNNHEISGTCQATLVITAAELSATVTLTGETVTYDGKVHKLLVSGDLTGVESVEYKYYSVTDPSTLIGNTGVKTAGAYIVVATLKGDSNHNDLTLPVAELKIERKHITVKADTVSITYGDDPATATYKVIVTGLANGEVAEDVLSISYAYDYVQYGEAGEYTITVTASDIHGNYVIDECVNGALIVTQKELTSVTWYDEENGTQALGALIKYVFDGSSTFLPYAEIEATDVVNGQTVKLVVEVEKLDAGNNYRARVTKILNMSGSVNENYAIPVHGFEINFTIEDPDPEEGDIVWDYSTAYYDGTAYKPAASRYNGTDWEDVDPDAVKTYKDGALSEAIEAGEYTAKVEGTDAEMMFSILPRRVYVVIGDMTVHYGETPNMNAVSWKYLDETDDAHKLLTGEAYAFTFTTTAVKGSPVGTYAITGSFASANADNYEVIFTGGSYATSVNNGKCGTLSVIKAVYDMTKVAFGATEVIYNGEYRTVTVSGLPEGVSARCEYVLGSFVYGADGVKNAGTYTVTVSFTGDDNHEVIADRTVTFVIGKAALTVTANNNQITYGDAPEDSGVSYEGFVGNDTENTEGVLSGALTYEINYAKRGNVGNYSITPAGLASDNYEISYKAGVLTVAKRTITVSWYLDQRKNSTVLKYTYDGATAFLPYAEAGNVVSGDTVTLTVTGEKIAAGINNRAEVVAVSNANYALPTDGSAAALFDVIPQAYVIVWDNTPMTYNGKVQKPDAYYFTAAGDRVTLDVTVTGGSPVAAGTYTAVADKGGLNLAGNTEHVFVIERLAVTVIVNDASSVYGEAIALNGWYVAEDSNNFIGGERPIYLDCNTGVKNAGTYEIKGVCTNTGNYDVTFVNGTYTIEKIEIDAPGIADGVYTAKPQKANVADTAVYQVLSNDMHTDVGTYSVVLRLNDYANYKWSGAPYETIVLKFSITKAENSWTTEFEVVNGMVAVGGGVINVIPAVPKFGNANNVTVEYYTDAACENAIAEYALTHTALEGTYYAKVYLAGTDNYNAIETVYSFQVTGKLEIKVYWEDTELTYNGRAQAPKAYVMFDGVTKTWLEVDVTDKTGATLLGGINAGDYKATAKIVAKDGTNLQSYKFAEDTKRCDFTILRVNIKAVIDEEASRNYLTSVYGDSTADLSRLVWSIVEGDVLAGESLGITFACEFGNAEFTPAGEYEVIGSASNGNYKVTFESCVYTVERATITVNKTSSEWFDEEGEIDKYQSHFVTLSEHVNLKGGMTANIVYATSLDRYVPELHDNMTYEQVEQLFEGGGQTTPPEIKQGGSWVVYYCITADNHVTKYGQWRVLIEDKDKFIIITFVKDYTVEYGESVEGKDLMAELVEGGCIEVSGTIDDLKLLSGIAKAYAYEDVGDEGYVNESTGAGKYAILFTLTDAAENVGLSEKVFKYSASNEPNSDTNLDKYVITARELSLTWPTGKLVYNGLSQIPAATLKGLIGGEEVELELVAGEAQKLTLENGDIINITARLIHGNDTTNSGAYSLRVTIDNANYLLEDGAITTVTIDKRPLEIVWGKNSFVYDGKSHIPTATLKDTLTGEETVIENIVPGQVTQVTLESGVVISLKFTLSGGTDTVNNSYGLSVSVEDDNYSLTKGTVITVTIQKEGEISLPDWAIYAIAGAAAVALLTIVIIAVKLKHRKPSLGNIDEDGFNDVYEE